MAPVAQATGHKEKKPRGLLPAREFNQQKGGSKNGKRKTEQMKIGLIDIDGHNFPNLALMKLSAWHKSQGDNVSFVNYLEEYDTVYRSKVFSFTPDDLTVIRSLS